MRIWLTSPSMIALKQSRMASGDGISPSVSIFRGSRITSFMNGSRGWVRGGVSACAAEGRPTI